MLLIGGLHRHVALSIGAMDNHLAGDTKSCNLILALHLLRLDRRVLLCSCKLSELIQQVKSKIRDEA